MRGNIIYPLWWEIFVPTVNLEFGVDNVGFVVTEVPYNSNDVSNILVPVCKEKEDCEITLDNEV